MAYSKLINDKRFDKYLSNKRKWIKIFTAIISFAVIFGFYIYGSVSSEMDNPEALYIGLVIATMFISIGAYSIFDMNSGKTWDGEVVSKDQKLKKRDIGYGNEHSYQEYMQYIISIRRNDGKIVQRTADDDDTVYNYYKIGDKVRYHKKLHSYEKYDKSKDDIIFCNACATLNAIKENNCRRCGCPLLK